ncbi:riboflavin synthase [Mahella australiensis]|uniref:Riboflavin synthase n=1 Tax=Mahella australiensis (strain DSM 15567 / CIP 107919 / 50-1 BON) TaxID=697281 RepID=F3ZYG8_MAHA5|nr:riboflavin synthase, alpha subunit [Mahella australiensis 50-1 BON]
MLLFTGIIQEIGSVRHITHGAQSVRLAVEAPKLISRLNIGDSICTNGTCLTVTDKEGHVFWADATPETVRRTTLFELKPGDPVNLEPSLTLQDFLGGHIVSGHVDGIGIIKQLRHEENALWLDITVGPDLLLYIVEKGSVAVDGVSLTVADVPDDRFSVSIIPHTAAQTTLKVKKAGDRVNIECDMIGRYVAKFLLGMKMPEAKSRGIDENFLRDNGFI